MDEWEWVAAARNRQTVLLASGQPVTSATVTQPVPSVVQRGPSTTGKEGRSAVADIYRKRPVTVEVMGPLAVENAVQVQSWCGGTIGTFYGEPVALIIPTLEGSMVASFGDYIIRGVQGEFYPCKPDIFAQTYELVEKRRG